MIHYDIVKSEDDVKAVVDLVRKVYTDTGYIAADLAHKVDLVSHTYIDRRDAVTIMAVMKNTKSLLGTVSVISDISEGVLPMDVVYNPELETFRKKGHKIAEVRRFAIDSEALKAENLNTAEEMDISVNLLGIAIKYAQYINCDMIGLMIKKEHRLFYESFGAIQIGDERPCPAINNMPVIAYVLNIQEAIKNKNFLMKKILSIQVPDIFFELN